MSLEQLLMENIFEKMTLCHTISIHKTVYDINGTPKVYILDKNKKILVNAIKGNIGIEQIDDLIRRENAKY